MIADGQALCIGSANLDVRSFFLSFEANAFIYDQTLAQNQHDQFQLDMENSRLADETYFKGRPAAARALTPICRLFSPLL